MTRNIRLQIINSSDEERIVKIFDPFNYYDHMDNSGIEITCDMVKLKYKSFLEMLKSINPFIVSGISVINPQNIKEHDIVIEMPEDMDNIEYKKHLDINYYEMFGYETFLPAHLVIGNNKDYGVFIPKQKLEYDLQLDGHTCISWTQKPNSKVVFSMDIDFDLSRGFRK